MAQIDLGKLKFQWKGLWTTSTAYEVDDVVHFDGSTYVVKTAVLNTNTTNPGLNASFELMARGIKYRGVYSSSATYLHNEVVTYNGASWISTQSVSFTNQTPETGSAFWEVLTPAPAANVLTTPGDIVFVAKDGVTSRLPVGSKGSLLQAVESPNQTFARGFTYSVGTATPATAIATDLDSGLVIGTNSTNGQITLTRGRSYSITFPTNGKTYSIKDPAAVGYATLGTVGRLGSGVTPTSVTNGGSLLFSPTSATPNSVKIRDELGGVDEITVNVVNMAVVPSWSGAGTQSATCRSLPGIYNTLTANIQPNSHAGGTFFGRGQTQASGWRTGNNRGSYIANNGKFYGWGDQTNSSSFVYNPQASGVAETAGRPQQLAAHLRLPRFFLQAIAGNPNESKWLTDLNGNALGYTTNSQPKIIQHVTSGFQGYFITENGMLFASGFGGYGILGNGSNTVNYEAAMPVQFYDTTTTALTGVNRPKIRFVGASNIGDESTSISCTYAIDTDGKVYRMGYNNYGQLGDGTTTNNFFMRQMNQALFNNEKIQVIFFGGGSSYTSVYAITESGKLWSWGYNANGQLGLNDLANRSAPVEATAVPATGITGKKILHVMSVGSGSGATKTWVLTTEGRVYAAGSGETFGNLLGVYSATSANSITFTELTNASTTINSGNQKVVSLWTTGGRYQTCFAITDGGTSNQPKVYSWGSNTYGALCRNESTTNTASAVIQGNWLLGEVRFRDFGDIELNPGTNNIRPNEIVGTQYDAVWNQKYKFGTMVAIWGNWGGASTANPSVAMLDSFGNIYIGGYWASYSPSLYSEADTLQSFDAASAFNTYFTPVFAQPEPMTDFSFMAQNAESWITSGVSGTVYVGGTNTYNTNADINRVSNGFNPLVRTQI